MSYFLYLCFLILCYKTPHMACVMCVMPYIFPPTWATIFSFFLKSLSFLTPEPNFVFKCDYLKLEAYGNIGGNVKLLRKSCVKPRGSLLNTTLVVMTLARGESLWCHLFPRPSFTDNICEWNCLREIVPCEDFTLWSLKRLFSSEPSRTEWFGMQHSVYSVCLKAVPGNKCLADSMNKDLN